MPGKIVPMMSDTRLATKYPMRIMIVLKGFMGLDNVHIQVQGNRI